MIITNGRVFCEDGVFRDIDVEILDGTITAIGNNVDSSKGEVLDAKGCFVIPGLVDIHTHGAVGVDFCDASKEGAEDIAKYFLKNGVTSFLGTTMTVPEEDLAKAYLALAPLVGARKSGQATLQGFNMEGPFFSLKRCGAQNPEYLSPAKVDMFERLYNVSGGTIKTVAVAPEIEEASDFISKVSQYCSVSLAHTDACYEVAKEGFLLGANHVTHLFNGMAPFTHREPGLVGAAVDAGAFVELISDGVHIHPTVVRSVFKLFGDDKVCLISDAMRACGLGDGEYDLGGQSVTVKGALATIENGSLAGSVTTLMDCLRKAISFGVPVESAIKAATINPAKAISIDDEVGSISVNKVGDIVLLDEEYAIKTVLSNGVVAF